MLGKFYSKCKECNKEYKINSAKHYYCSKACRDESAYKRTKSKKRPYGICYICGSKEGLHEHHIIPRSEHGKETVSLCNEHHILMHKFMSMLKSKGYKITFIDI